MAVRAVIGLKLSGPGAGGRAAERLREVKGVSVLGAVASRRDLVAAILVAVKDLRALKWAVEEARRVEGVREAIVLMAGEELWAELARMDEEGYP